MHTGEIFQSRFNMPHRSTIFCCHTQYLECSVLCGHELRDKVAGVDASNANTDASKFKVGCTTNDKVEVKYLSERSRTAGLKTVGDGGHIVTYVIKYFLVLSGLKTRQRRTFSSSTDHKVAY